MASTNTRHFPNIDMALLTPRQRLVVTLHLGEGWTLTDIAESIGVTKQAVSCSYTRAISRIRLSIEGSALTKTTTV